MDIESLKSFFCFLCFWFFVRKEDGRKEGRSYLLSYSNRRLLQQGYYVLSCIVFPSLFFVFEESPRNCLFENHEESGCTPMNNPTVYIGLTPLDPRTPPYTMIKYSPPQNWFPVVKWHPIVITQRCWVASQIGSPVVGSAMVSATKCYDGGAKAPFCFG